MALIEAESNPNTSPNKTLLEETFYVLKKRNSVFRVKLTKIGLCLIKENEVQLKTQVIPVKDIIGCRCLRSKKQTRLCTCNSLPQPTTFKVVDEKSGEHDDSDISAYLYIYAYILHKDCSKRERTTITLRFRSFDKYEDNYKEAQRWRCVLKKLIRGEDVTHVSLTDYTINYIRENRRLLVLLSPKSGSGKGRALFQKKVVPILQEAEVPYDLHITKYANYAREFIRTCNLFQWSGVIVVGGDGIVFEVINGLFERMDWSEALNHIAVGVIPGGSGNGLARSIAYSCLEPYGSPTLPAALAAVRNNYEPMDLVRVETTSQIMFSFLSVGWGLLSDIDIESEGLRILGGQRFALWSVARLIGLRSYSGKVSYLPANASLSLPYDSGIIRNSDNKYELPAEVHLETQESRQRLDSWYSAASRRSTYFSTTGSSYQSTAESSGDSINRSRIYGPASQLPCITAPLPQSWKCISGRFIMVHASYQTHLGSDCLFAPSAKLNDGVIWLLIIHGGASRAQMLKFLLGLSVGSHADPRSRNGNIELIPVKAFRIEPDMNEHGYMTVDGEHVEYGPIQAEVFPALVKVMVP